MFQAGDLVVYGSTGVCRVEGITQPGTSGADRDRQFYLLKPLQQDGVIYTPVDNAKVPMRPVISREEAEARLRSQFPALEKARRAQVVIDTSGSIGYTKAMIPPLYAQELGLSDAPDEGGPHGESPDAHPAPPAR